MIPMEKTLGSLGYVSEQAKEVSKRNNGTPVSFIFNHVNMAVKPDTPLANIESYFFLRGLRTDIGLGPDAPVLGTETVFEEMDTRLDPIFACASRAVQQSKKSGKLVVFKFNENLMVVLPTDTTNKVCAYYDQISRQSADRRRDTWDGFTRMVHK